jgi:hypothetical protein
MATNILSIYLFIYTDNNKNRVYGLQFLLMRHLVPMAATVLNC